jgi:hypothetical protein
MLKKKRDKKFVSERPYADPDVAARKIIDIANTVESTVDGRIHVELINGPFLYQAGGNLEEYKAGLELAIAAGWLVEHESGTYVSFTQAGRISLADQDVLRFQG